MSYLSAQKTFQNQKRSSPRDFLIAYLSKKFDETKNQIIDSVITYEKSSNHLKDIFHEKIFDLQRQITDSKEFEAFLFDELKQIKKQEEQISPQKPQRQRQKLLNQNPQIQDEVHKQSSLVLTKVSSDKLNTFPFNVIGILVCQYQQMKRYGTAFMIGQDVILTAFHNIRVMTQKKILFPKDMYFCLNFNRPWEMKRKVMNGTFYNQEYFNLSDDLHYREDLVVLFIEQRIMQEKYFQFDPNAVDLQKYQHQNIGVCGFPKSGNVKTHYEMSQAQGEVKIFIDSQKKRALGCTMKLEAGMSGSPLFIKVKNQLAVIGVYYGVMGNKTDPTSVGCFIDQKKKSQIQRIRKLKGTFISSFSNKRNIIWSGASIKGFQNLYQLTKNQNEAQNFLSNSIEQKFPIFHSLSSRAQNSKYIKAIATKKNQEYLQFIRNNQMYKNFDDAKQIKEDQDYNNYYVGCLFRKQINLSQKFLKFRKIQSRNSTNYYYKPNLQMKKSIFCCNYINQENFTVQMLLNEEKIFFMKTTDSQSLEQFVYTIQNSQSIQKKPLSDNDYFSIPSFDLFGENYILKNVQLNDYNVWRNFKEQISFKLKLDKKNEEIYMEDGSIKKLGKRIIIIVKPPFWVGFKEKDNNFPSFCGFVEKKNNLMDHSRHINVSQSTVAQRCIDKVHQSQNQYNEMNQKPSQQYQRNLGPKETQINQRSDDNALATTHYKLDTSTNKQIRNNENNSGGKKKGLKIHFHRPEEVK